MITKMIIYYWDLVSHTGRFLTMEMLWFLDRDDYISLIIDEKGAYHVSRR